MTSRAVSVAAGASLGAALTLRSVPRVPVFEGTAEGVDPWLVSALPSAAAFVVCVAIGAAVGWVVPRKLAAPFLLTGLSVLVFVPAVFSVAPFVSVFSGRFLDFVIVAAFVYAALHVAKRFEWRWTARRVGVVSFCVLALAAYTMHRDVGLSGDEPHYFLIAHSLVEDGDLRVRDNYFAEDYRQFFAGSIGARLAKDSDYSVHGIGLPILIAPGYALFGVVGAVATLIFVGALLAAGIFVAVSRIAENASAAVVAAFSFVLTSPALFLSVSAYPELPAALVAVLVAGRFASEAEPSPRSALLWSLLVGTLPFFHMKFIPLAVVLWGALALRTRRPVALGAVVSLLALAAFFYAITGSPNPMDAYGRQRIFASGIPIGLLGLFFDQEFGLLPYAPIYLAALCGVVTMAARERLLTLLVLASVALPGAAHPLWSGGTSPPARFLFPALPLLSIALGCLWAKGEERGVSHWVPTLAAISVTLAGFMLLLPGQPLYLNARDGTGQLWDALSSSWDVPSYLPSIATADSRSMVLAGMGVVFVVACVMLRRRPLPPFPVVLLAAALAQDLTNVPRPRRHEGRWVTSMMRNVADQERQRFVALPELARLDRDGMLRRVSLRLRPLRPDGDPRYWWSLPYSIPAGSYRVGGIRIDGWAPCQDYRCFEVEGERFESEVALARFRVRARRLENPPPRLYFESLVGARPVARDSRPVSDERRLHSLDDGAMNDRRGFWVRARSRAAFVLEPGGELFLSNGGVENTVIVETSAGEERLELAPYERARIEVPTGVAPEVFFVESLSGFQPSELSPDSADRRQLGVLVGAPRF